MKNFEIKELIPQREPFIMVDKLVSFEENKFSSVFRISTNNCFNREGLFREEGLIENMAQTAAAGAGYSFRIEGKQIKLGYIGAIKNVTINSLPKEDSLIYTEIIISGKVLNVDIVEGKIFDEYSNVIASCEMKIFIEK